MNRIVGLWSTLGLVLGCTPILDSEGLGTSTSDTSTVDRPTGSSGSAGSSPATSDDTGNAPPSSGMTGTGLVPLCEGSADGWSDSGMDGSDGGPLGMDDDMPLVSNIPEIQQGGVGESIWVLIEGVVVITRASVAETGSGSELFVQDPAGGPWSGLRVRLPSVPEPPPMGAAIDLRGAVIERNGFYIFDLVESGGNVTVVGDGVIPPPATLSVASVELGSGDGRPYEGTVVRVEQVMVTDDDPCDGEFTIDDVTRVDDRLAPGLLPSPAPGSMLGAVQGVLVYAEDSLEIAPMGPEGVE